MSWPKVARAFRQALLRKLRVDAVVNSKEGGLESPLCNNALLSQEWHVVSAWRWERPRHINIQPPKSRQTVALDSNVGLCALVKGRSSSFGLRASVRKIGATVVAGCLHPSYHFSPLILFRPAYAKMLRCLSLWILLRRSPQEVSGKLGSFVLQLLVYPGKLEIHAPQEEPLSFCVNELHSAVDFDSTLGYPGEGPADCELWILPVFWNFNVVGSLAVFLTFPYGLSLSVLSLLDFLFLGFLAFHLPPEMPPSESCFLWIWRLAPLVVLDSCVGAVSHGQPLQP